MGSRKVRASRRGAVTGSAPEPTTYAGVVTREPVQRRSQEVDDNFMRKLICHETGHPPSVFEPRTDAHRAAVTVALMALNHAVFCRLLLAEYLIKLRPALQALITSASSVRRLLRLLWMDRDDGQRGMEEIIAAVYEFPELFVPIRFLHEHVLGFPERDRKIRETHPDLPQSVFEIVEDLLESIDDQLLKLGEKPRGRGRPRQHPAIDQAIAVLRRAGMQTGEIQDAIGNEIEATRVHVQRTRNDKSYDKARDPKRALRSRPGRKQGRGGGEK